MRERLVFVGENRSQTAQEKGYSWEECQRTGHPVLSAIRLFDALSSIGLDPNVQIFINLWEDNANPNQMSPLILKEMSEEGEIIVAMGRKVSAELKRLGIPHKKIIHPAARGKIANKIRYRFHIKEALQDKG